MIRSVVMVCILAATSLSMVHAMEKLDFVMIRHIMQEGKLGVERYNVFLSDSDEVVVVCAVYRNHAMNRCYQLINATDNMLVAKPIDKTYFYIIKSLYEAQNEKTCVDRDTI